MPEKHDYNNRLIHEKSPYLQQHAHNPVDWYPWNPEAFKAASDLDKPIFLSIGYSTCHWCHVMEKESFENIDVADLLNDTFVCIKVDREELPEIDSLYMEFAQSMMSGAAGWPLNVILTPELQPFFAATYLPPFSRQGMMGLTDIIKRIKDLWQSDEREKVLEQADGIVHVFQQNLHSSGEAISSKDLIEDAAELLFRMADPIYGGIKGAPKFPIGFQQNFMMRYSLVNKDSRAMFLVNRTLDRMQQGGIYDHLGGGFARYSVDEHWIVPHFEKMLYDNALLIQSYLEAYQAEHEPRYKKTIEDIFDYVIREMTHPEGGYYSAEDADSEGNEGFFYTWTYAEIMSLLGSLSDIFLFCDYFNVTKEGNFEGRNILHTNQRLEEFTKERGLDPSRFELSVKEYKRILFAAREKRQHPFKDDKIITSWNGLMIAALAEAGAVLNDLRLLESAERAAGFIREHLWDGEQLKRRWRDGEAFHQGGLDDYANIIRACIILFEAGRGTEWLSWAIRLTDEVEQHFKVTPNGAYYMTTATDPYLILRKCQFSDGAEPSGNAIHCENLLRLYRMTLDQKYLNSAEDILKAVADYIEQYPPGYCYHLINLLYYYDRNAVSIVISLKRNEEKTHEIRYEIYKKFLPHKVVIWREEDDEELLKSIPFLRELKPIKNETTLYVCHDGRCEEPTSGVNNIIEKIKKI